MAKEISLREYSAEVEEYLRSARIDEAIAHASQILSAYPKNANAYRNLGRALMRQQRYEEAGEIFRRLLGAIPDDFSAHYQLSIVYEQAKQGDAALFHIERAFDQQPNNKQVNDRLRALYKSLKNTEVEKIQLTAGAVASQYLKAGSYSQAIDLLKRTIAKMPDRTDLQLLLARTYWESEQALEAAETCIALLKNSPYVLEANRIMTEFWLAQERPSDAQRFLSRIEELDPYFAFEIATGKAVPDEQFTLEKLDFSKYAAAINAQQSPDWLENIEIQDQAPEEETPAEGDWLKQVDAAAQPPAPAKKKVTDSLEGLLPDDFDFPVSAGADDSVSDAEEDDLAALLGSLASDESDSPIVSSEAKSSDRASTGLTGMLRNLGGADTADDDDDWLKELSSGRYDTGELGEPKESLNDLFAELETESQTSDAIEPAAEIAHTEDALAWLGMDEEAEEEVAAAEDTGALPSAAAKAYDPNDPMAWLTGTGIEVDDAAEKQNLNFFEDDEPTALASQANDPMAWLGGDKQDERFLETNEFKASAEAPSADDALAWLNDDALLDEPMSAEADVLSTDALSEDSDPLSWMAETGQDDAGEWESDEDILAELLDLASLTDEHEAVPDYPSETEAVMSNQDDWTANELPQDDDEDMGLEWLDDSEDDAMAWMGGEAQEPAPAEEDPMAWMSSSEEDPMAWLSASDDEEEPVASPADELGDLFGETTAEADDSMAWLSASTEDEEEPVANTGDLSDFFGEATAEESEFDLFGEEQPAANADFDFLGEEESTEPEAPSGMTGMLSRFQTDESAAEEAADWLGELDTSDAFEHEDDMSWLNTLDGKETPETAPAETSPVSEFANDFGSSSEEEQNLDWAASTESSDDFDWGTSGEEAQSLDWAVSSESESSDFGDFGEEEAEPAGEDWLSELGSPEAPVAFGGDFGGEELEPAMSDDFSFGEDEELEPAMSDDFSFGEDEEAEPAQELDWMTSLGAETDDFGGAELEPAMSDDFSFGEEEAEPAQELDWMTSLGAETDDFGGAELEPAMTDDFSFGEDEEAEPAQELDWMTSLGAETDDFGGEELEPAMTDDFSFGEDEEAEPAQELDWMTSLGEESGDLEGQELEPAMSDDFGDFGEEEAEQELDWMGALGEESGDLAGQELEPAMTDDFSFGEDEEAEPAQELDWMSSLDTETDDFGGAELEPAMSDDFGDFGEEEAEQELDWMGALGEESGDFEGQELEPAMTDDFDDFGEEEAEPAQELDWMTALDDESGDLEGQELEPAVTDALDEGTAWGDVGSSGFTDELHEEAQGTAWGDVGSSGFTDELHEEAQGTAWGDVGSSGFTDELHEEPSAQETTFDWMNAVSEDADDYADEEEEASMPQKSTFGMTGMLNSIRATRGEELEESLDALSSGDDAEPEWLGHVTGEVEQVEEAIEASYQPLPATSIDSIDWGDIVSSQELEALPFEESEPVQAQFEEVAEARPLAEVLHEEASFVAEAVPSYDDTVDEGSNNAPDWLNAMVPGLDLDFEAEEDAALEADYAERERNMRERSLSETANASEFSWLQAIVEEESGMMDAVEYEDDYVAPAPPPLPQRQQYRFSQLPLWLRQSPASAIAMNADSSATPDYLSDFEDFDDSSDFEDFDDDFEFEDFDEFDK